MLETKRVASQKVSSWWDMVTPLEQCPIIGCVFLITSLYVPSGLQTGTKTCGKSFLACCSVYFFSATHLDVSEENHKSPESVNVTEKQGSGCSPSGFL